MKPAVPDLLPVTVVGSYPQPDWLIAVSYTHLTLPTILLV